VLRETERERERVSEKRKRKTDLLIESSPIDRSPIHVSLHSFEFPPHPLHGIALHGRLLGSPAVLQIGEEGKEEEAQETAKDDIPWRRRDIVPSIDIPPHLILLISVACWINSSHIQSIATIARPSHTPIKPLDTCLVQHSGPWTDLFELQHIPDAVFEHAAWLI
jgi:hypothetical protein